MNWQDIQTVLDETLDKLEAETIPRLPQPPADVAPEFQVLIRTAFEPGQTVLDALTAIAQNTPLPPLTPEQRRLVWMRVHFASNFAAALHTAPPVLFRQPPAQRSHAIQWLLTEAWDPAGGRTLLAFAEMLFHVSGGSSDRFSRN